MMISDWLPILLVFATAATGIAVFLPKKLLHSVIFLALTAGASSLIFLYLDQVLLALLQLLVFVGGLSTYLLVAIATEEKEAGMRRSGAFVFVIIVILLDFSLFVYNQPVARASGNSFSATAQIAFSSYFAFLLISIFLLFAVAISSVLVIKKISKLVV